MPGRETRVAALVGVILVLSLLDLVLTLTYVMEIGLIEDNPLARGILAAGGPGLLVAWKVLTVAVTNGILVWSRRHPVAEIGALVCVAVLVWLTFRWNAYIEVAPALTSALHEIDALSSGAWVTLADRGPEAP